MQIQKTFFVLVLTALVANGCDKLGIEDPAKLAAAREAEGKAIGSACRQSGRAIEECYDMNPKAQKAAMFAGWREMDGYMRENKMEAATPPVAAAPTKAADAKPAETAAPAEKGETKGKTGKSATKH